MKYEIEHRHSGIVLYSGEFDTLRECVLKAMQSGADLSRADLSGADLSGANLLKADLSRANLPRADLFGANISGADLFGANLHGADLSRANLSRANLSRAYLSRANLSGADLSRANLSWANLSWANLSGADLSGADLSEAYIGSWAPCTKPPIQLVGLKWPVMIADTHMQIGCELHSFSEWAAFSDRDILAMDGKPALQFWKVWKKPLLAMCHAKP